MNPRAESGDRVLEHLQRVLASKTFETAGRSRTLLQFLIEETVNGRSERLKEYTLGAEGLGKGDAFDPRTDPIVRAEASRLRTRLERYYATEGRDDAIVIELPKGAYVPQFRVQDKRAESEPGTPKAKRLTSGLLAVAAGLGLLAVVAIAAWTLRAGSAPGDPAAVARFDAQLLSRGVLGSEVGTDVVVSPDGTKIVFVSQTTTGESRLNTRTLDQSNAIEMPGTEGARGPFFSPDSHWVGFWAGGKLKKIAVDGGLPQVLCDAPDLLGGSWGDDGNIVAALGRNQLSRVPSSGGPATVVLDLGARALSPVWPQVLPGARQVLFTAVGAGGPNGATIDVLSMPGGVVRGVQHNGTFGRYLPQGYLTYINQGTLFAVAFSTDRIEVRGAGTPILDDVAYSSAFGYGQMDVSRTGTLVYRRSIGGGRFVVDWIDATGQIAPLLTKPGHYLWPDVAPDRRRVALTTTESGTDAVWIYDSAVGETTRISGLDGISAARPLWTRDGEALIVGTRGHGLVVVEPRADAKPQPLLPRDTIDVPWSFSPDGRRLAYYEMSPSNAFDLWTVPVQKVGTRLTAGTPEPLLQTPAYEVYPTFSPDGQWLAYGSLESGTWEVYVRHFPDNGTKVRASSAGGRIPLWSPTTHELLYETDRQTLMAVSYAVRDGAFLADPPIERLHGLGDTGVLANVDVAADGRVVALMPASTPEDERQNHATFILNFFELVRRRVATATR